MLKQFVFAMLVICTGVAAYSQGKMSIANVHAALLRNSGTIMENNETKGYFFFYQSDRINKQTNEYTLQILDQNVNKVIDIKFEDTKRLSLLEAAYNNSSLAFLFKNNDNRTLGLKVYDTGGRLKYSYSRSLDNKSEDAMKRYQAARADAGTNNTIFDVGEKGYASVYPVCSGEQISYEVDFYSSETRHMWTYVPANDKEKYVSAAYLGNTDSLIIFRVLNKRSRHDKVAHPEIVAINFHTGKKAFAIDGESDGVAIMPSGMMHIKETERILLMGNYYQSGNVVLNRSGEGIAAYEIDSTGNVLLKKFTSWSNAVAPLYIHKLVQSNEKLFAVAERNKGRNSERKSSSVSDLMMIEFDNQYQVSNVTAQNTARSFDYAFTARNNDNTNFAVCYSDYVKSADYKGQVFNSIRYNGERFVNDKIKLKTRANKIQVLPAKMGSVMIVEYFRKSRKLEIRIEKMG